MPASHTTSEFGSTAGENRTRLTVARRREHRVVDSTQAFSSAWGRRSGDYSRDDTALLDRLRSGDDSALSALHERHVRVVYGVVVDRLGAEPEAQEVTHDVFLTLWRKSRRITLAGTSCLPWLLVTADSLARGLARTDIPRRRQRARRTVPGSDASHDAAEGRRSDGWREAQRIMATFQWADREVLRLCTEEGLSYRQAARRVRDVLAERSGR